MIRHFATGVALVLCALLLWAPLPFGSVTRWSSALVQAVAFGALCLAAMTARARDLRAVAAPAAALSAVAVLGALQALPWPSSLAAVIAFGDASLRESLPGAVPLSLASDASARTALMWAACAAVLICAAVAGRRRDRRRWLATAILTAALFQVLAGAGPWIARSTQIWGVTVPGDPTRLRGTFVNPDHLAVFLELALPIAFAWSWWGARHARPDLPAERRLLLVVVPPLIWIVLFLGLAFTGSRGGLAAALFAVVAQGLLLARAARRRLLAPVGAMAGLAGLGVVAAIGLQEGFGRLASTSAYEVTWNSRRQIYAATWRLWHDFPWTGTGLGAFRDSIGLTQPSDLPGSWWHAHSDWLELLATVGVLGALAFLMGLVPLMMRLVRGWTSEARSEDRSAVLAALGALLSLAIHESIDFGLTIPANAMTLAALVGVACIACAPQPAREAIKEAQDQGGPPPEPLGLPKPPRPPEYGGRRRRRGAR